MRFDFLYLDEPALTEFVVVQKKMFMFLLSMFLTSTEFVSFPCKHMLPSEKASCVSPWHSNIYGIVIYNGKGQFNSAHVWR